MRSSEIAYSGEHACDRSESFRNIVLSWPPHHSLDMADRCKPGMAQPPPVLHRIRANKVDICSRGPFSVDKTQAMVSFILCGCCPCRQWLDRGAFRHECRRFPNHGYHHLPLVRSSYAWRYRAAVCSIRNSRSTLDLPDFPIAYPRSLSRRTSMVLAARASVSPGGTR